MILYLDTSAYLKLVVREERTDELRALFGEASPAVTSVITYAESCSAMGRRRSEGDMSTTQLDEWKAALDERWGRTVAVRVVSRPAGDTALKHSLRGMDAIQLATAIHVRDVLLRYEAGPDLRFAAFDRRLLAAAEREGFATLGGALD